MAAFHVYIIVYIESHRFNCGEMEKSITNVHWFLYLTDTVTIASEHDAWQLNHLDVQDAASLWLPCSGMSKALVQLPNGNPWAEGANTIYSDYNKKKENCFNVAINFFFVA